MKHRHPMTGRWQPRNRPGAAPEAGLLRYWLLDQGSLTKALRALSDNRFRVEILRQQWCYPRADERALLRQQPRRRALLREVLLYGEGEAWVYARSILPETSLRGPLRFMRKLDERPLGALLFRNPRMRRGDQQIARLPGAMLPAPLGADGNDTLWGRRSVFFLYDEPLLVSEIFLPALEARLTGAPRRNEP